MSACILLLTDFFQLNQIYLMILVPKMFTQTGQNSSRRQNDEEVKGWNEQGEQGGKKSTKSGFTFSLSRMDPLPRIDIFVRVSSCSLFNEFPRGPRSLPTKLNCNRER